MELEVRDFFSSFKYYKDFPEIFAYSTLIIGIIGIIIVNKKLLKKKWY